MKRHETYSREKLPSGEWGRYVKRIAIKAVRMDGYFEVWTDKGVESCEDGWIALDDHGNPFPVAAEEFERQYRPESQVYIDEPIDARVRRVRQILDWQSAWDKYSPARKAQP